VKFGPIPIAQAEGAILAHGLALEGLRFKKGRVLSAADIDALARAGLARVVAARLQPEDVHEDAAAAALADALEGPGLAASAAFTGRCNLIVQARGLVIVDRARLDALNAVHESLTVATLPPYTLAEPRQMAATIKVIPFAVPRQVLEQCVALARGGGAPILRVAPMGRHAVGLIQTRLSGTREAILDKTRAATDARLAALDCPPVAEARCAHEPDALAAALRAQGEAGHDVILISGASAIVDRRDVVPAAIVAAGGEIEHFGMPVDPGNLLLLARLGATPVLGLPGCARSPRLNGFDWVLHRLLAGEAVTSAHMAAMGAGGLLKEIGARPLPRAQAVEAPVAPGAPRIAALVLAAGRSRRMGTQNKLLCAIDGQPMIVRTVTQIVASAATPVLVVTGHEHGRVEAALDHRPVTFVHNPDYAGGLSTSLHRGLAALPRDVDGVVVCLGDMPRVSAAVIDRLIAAFDPIEGRAICVPTWAGKRGNPVLFAGRFVPEVQEIAGDVGARHLLGEYPDLVCEVAMDDLAGGAGVLLDVDTPEALNAAMEGG